MPYSLKSALVGKRLVWGVPPIRPVVGAPAGQQRLRLRVKSAGILFVRTADGIRQFYLEDHGDVWRPGFEVARNHRPKN